MKRNMNVKLSIVGAAVALAWATPGDARVTRIIVDPTASLTGQAVPYETITAMTGVEQLDLLNATHTIVLARDEARVLNLRAVVLP